jgi:hypothetical protein
MSVIQIKRNTNTDEGALAAGEFGFHDVALGKLFVGSTTGNQEVAMKAYVDSVAQGLHPITDVVAATTEALAACAYDNGTAGVGATLTEDAANGALAAVDGVTLTLNQRVLVKDQADTFENGVYQLSQVGTGAAKWILTRVTDMDVADEIASTFVFVTGGTVGADTGWVCTTEPESVVLGTSAITFAQFSAAGQITAGTGLTKTGNTLNVDFGIANTKAVKIDAADVADDEYARFTANGLESRSASEVKTDIGLGNVTNIKNKLDATTAPAATDDDDPGGYSVGSLWLDVTADKAYICLDNTAGNAVWKEIGSAGATAFIGLSDVPANYTDDGLKVVRVNAAANALEFVAFAATYLEGTPTENEAGKAPTSEWAFDHAAATTGVHGAGGNTLLHSGSTIDGGVWGA